MKNEIHTCEKSHKGMEYFCYFDKGKFVIQKMDWSLYEPNTTPHLVDESEHSTICWCSVLGCESFYAEETGRLHLSDGKVLRSEPHQATDTKKGPKKGS